jgi:hypothetical protein
MLWNKKRAVFVILLFTLRLSGQAFPQHPARRLEPQADLAEITVGSNPVRAIPPTFIGIDMEWERSSAMFGNPVTGVNTIYRNLLRNLSAYGSGPVIIRIGGDSTDSRRSVSNVAPFADVAKAVGSRFILGVNLGAGHVQLAIDQTKAYVSQMPPNSLEAIEIGNEPDAYDKRGLRPAPYTFAQYLKEYDRWREQIFPLLPPGTRLLGPAWAWSKSLANVRPFLDAEHSYLYGVSQHTYLVSGTTCDHIFPPDTLLQPNLSTAGPSQVAAAVSLTHSYKLQFILDELNSVSSCGGIDGISNIFASALWAIDTLFEYATVGVDQVLWFNENSDFDSAFEFGYGKNGENGNFSSPPVSPIRLRKVKPLYYGMLLFQEATGHNAHLVPVSLKTHENVKAFATVDSAGALRLVVINKSSKSGTIHLALSGDKSASVTRLLAPSLGSKDGVTIGGQTFDGSSDGKLLGTQRLEVLKPVNGLYQFSSAAGSAMLISFSR